MTACERGYGRPCPDISPLRLLQRGKIQSPNRAESSSIRSMGRTWMAEEGENHAAAEACLAHRIGSDVELAYNRSDLFAIRRGIMERWGNYVEWCIKKGVTRE